MTFSRFLLGLLAPLLLGVQAQARHFTLGVIPRQTQSRFWLNFKSGADLAAAEFNKGGKNSVTLLWRGPLRGDEWASQLEIMDAFTARRIDAILIAPVAGDPLAPAIENAVNVGVPTLGLDSAFSHAGLAASLRLDNTSAGKEAARQLANAINGRGRVALMRCQTNTPASTTLEVGFLDGLRDFPDVSLVALEGSAGFSRQSAREAALRWMADPKLKLDGVFCLDEPAAEGMYDALRVTPSSHCRMVSYEITRDLAKGIVEGIASAAIVQDAKAFGKAAVEAALEVARKRPAPVQPTVPFKVINRENVREKETVEWLGLDLK